MFIALDLETTGLNPDKDRIIEIAAVRMNEDGTIQDEYQTLINPGTPLPDLIQHLTGLTDDDLKDAPTIDEVREDVIKFIGSDPILGHSVQFDINFLAASNIPAPGTVLDTFHLSQTLLLNEPSYSLEILSEKFELVHESKHRALDDTKVAIELYKLLVEKIREIPFEAAEQIRAVLNKSDFGWKDVFVSNLTADSGGAAPSLPRPPEQTPRRGASHSLQIEVEAALTNSVSAIFESPEAISEDLVLAATTYSEKSGEKCLLITPEPQQISRDARVAHLQHPARYLCESRFQEFLQKDHFDNHEARLLTKVIIWQSQGGTGEKNEIVVGDDEHPTWEQISALPHLYEECDSPDCAYKKALQKAKISPVLVVSQHLYIDNLTRQGALIPQKPHLLIDGLELIEETALRALTKYYALPRIEPLARNVDEEIASKLEILFGLLGMFLEKHSPPGAFQKQTILEPAHYQTPEGKKILDTLENLEQKINTIKASPNQRFLHKDIQILKKAFAGNPNVLTWIMLNYEGMPVIRTCPAKIGPLLKQELWDKAPSTTIFLSNYGSLEGNFEFIKSQLHLSKDLPELILEPEQDTSLELHAYPELPGPRLPKNLPATIDVFKKSEKTCTFILVNAISVIDNLHHKLADHLKEQEILLLSQGVSGGMGKIGQRFTKAKEPVFLIGNERLYRSILKNNPEAAKRIEVLYIHRLPFIPPSHPVHQKQCETLSNSWYEYSLPQATLRLKRFLHFAQTRTSVSTIHILDPRLDQYEGKFLKSIKSICKNA
jgi:DNA polymerase III epsilon subunit family exonuclease